MQTMQPCCIASHAALQTMATLQTSVGFCKKATFTTQREVSFMRKLFSCAAKILAYMLQASVQLLFDPCVVF